MLTGFIAFHRKINKTRRVLGTIANKPVASHSNQDICDDLFTQTLTILRVHSDMNANIGAGAHRVQTMDRGAVFFDQSL